jgi:acetyl esterase/lipase
MSSDDLEGRYHVDVFDREYLRHGDECFLATLYQPQGQGPFPMLLGVHGGAWNTGSRSELELFGQELAAAGILVSTIDFRLAPDHPYPAQVQDVHYACRWLKLHAAELNGDPTRVGVIGASSGGHTSLLCATRPNDPRYSALPLDAPSSIDAWFQYVISCWGVIDPWVRYLFCQTTPQAGEGFGGAEVKLRQTLNYFQNEAAIHEGNPQEMLERGELQALPRLLIIQGTDDMNIPLTLPQRFAAAYRAAGGSVQVEWFPRQPHGFARRPGPAATRAIEIIKEFVAV